jgi:membrane protease YdiL (CAAX protease family)
VIPLWFLGVALALAYQNTGSLLLPICVHGLFNLMTALSLLLDKGNS